MTHALISAPSTAVVEGTEERLLLPARRAGYELPVIGTSDEPDGDLYLQAPTGHWWLITDHRSDHTAALYGGVVVPDEEREKLTDLLREGFAPDRLLIGHEFELGWTPGDPLPDPVPRARRMALARRALEVSSRRELATASTTATLKVGRTALAAVKALVVGAVVVGTAIGTVFSQLDPVVVAGVRDPETGTVTWVEVARWSW